MMSKDNLNRIGVTAMVIGIAIIVFVTLNYLVTPYSAPQYMVDMVLATLIGGYVIGFLLIGVSELIFRRIEQAHEEQRRCRNTAEMEELRWLLKQREIERDKL